MADGEIFDLLRKLGLNQYESRTYHALLMHGPTTAGNISSLAKIPRPRVYDVLSSLEKEGFVMVQPGRPVKYTALPISHVRETLKHNHKENLDRKLKEIDAVADELDSRFSNVKSSPEAKEAMDLAWTLRGRASIYAKLQDLLSSAKGPVYIATSDTGLMRKANIINNVLEAAKDKPSQIYVLAPLDKVSEHVKNSLKDKVTLVHKNDDYRFMIFDDEHVLLILTPEASNGRSKNEIALWVRSPEFSKAFKEMVHSRYDLNQ